MARRSSARLSGRKTGFSFRVRTDMFDFINSNTYDTLQDASFFRFLLISLFGFGPVRVNNVWLVLRFAHGFLSRLRAVGFGHTETCIAWLNWIIVMSGIHLRKCVTG